MKYVTFRYDTVEVEDGLYGRWRMFSNHSVVFIRSYRCCVHRKTHNLFWPDENRIEQCCAVHIVQGCQQHWTSWWAWISLQSGVTMLNNIVDNLEQCGQQNIVQCCFHQARTGGAFFAVYFMKILSGYCNYWLIFSSQIHDNNKGDRFNRLAGKQSNPCNTLMPRQY